ncbi:hypothetical protein GCM10025789_02840 [Tessaracoccus lubricantis]|uniref:DUF4157 domain-containing protein n=1 Tax=Tessaracoccus lubricantis TaxID=545543 RepID=A0ABP9F0B6_9ACTN
MDTSRLIRNVANAVNLSSVLGLVLGVAGRGRLRRRGHLLVFENVRLSFINASAMTVGDVVLVPGRTIEEVERRVPDLMAHEEAHAWQYAYCLGLPFIPLYALAAGWSMFRSGDRATANHFEVQADLLKGGYAVGTKRPISQAWRRRADRAA